MAATRTWRTAIFGVVVAHDAGIALSVDMFRKLTKSGLVRTKLGHQSRKECRLI